MPRRVSLPGAAELFRVTGDFAPTPEPSTPSPRTEPTPLHGAGERADRAPSRPVSAAPPAGESADAGEDDWAPAAARTPRRRRPASSGRGPTGRERHEEKITVYCSADELIDLEQARLTLRGEFGMAVDRGRIVREAIAVVLADLDAKGESSILLRRLRGL
ncbi:hypothetical protein acdb102_42810 [Acidothermaceae bacterium B102]|nr:hypothetical protein acdb102_42810 [Acidothermaceae bacterium B102]